MKKTIRFVNVRSSYRIQEEIGHLGLITPEEGKKGIVDLDTSQAFLEPGQYTITYDKRIICVLDKDHMTIYDAVAKKTIIKNMTVATIYSPNKLITFWTHNGKKLIFDLEEYIKTGSTANKEYDKVDLLTRHNENVELVVTENGKVSSYKSDEIKDADSVERINNITIVAKNNKKRFIAGDYKSADFDNITFDEKDPSIIYCQDKDTIHAFILQKNFSAKTIAVELIKAEAEKLEFVDKSDWPKDYRGTYRFKCHKGSGITLIATYVSGSAGFYSCEYLLPEGELFDEVTVRENDILLTRDGKTGLAKNGNYIEPIYDGVDSYPNSLYVFHKDGIDTILYIHREIVEIVNGVHVIEVEGNNIIFSKGDEIGIYAHTPLDNKPVLGYTSYRRIYKDFYELTKKSGLKDVYNNGEVILSDVDNISIHEGPDDHLCYEYVFIIYSYGSSESLEYELACFKIRNNQPAELDHKLSDDYTYIAFLSDIIYFENADEIVLADYDEGALDYLPKGTVVKEYPVSEMDSNHATVYQIDGEDYIFSDGSLVKTETKENTIYMAAYECDYGTVVVNASEDSFQEKCRAIECLPESSVEDTLKRYYETHETVQEAFPKLVLTPKNK